MAKSIERLGPDAAELFVYGFISADTEDSERLAEGAKMSAWAFLPVALVPAAKTLRQTKLSTVTVDFVQRAIAKTVAPIADKLASLTAKKAKRTFVSQAMNNADDLYFQENGRYLNEAEKKVLSETLNDIVVNNYSIYIEHKRDWDMIFLRAALAMTIHTYPSELTNYLDVEKEYSGAEEFLHVKKPIFQASETRSEGDRFPTLNIQQKIYNATPKIKPYPITIFGLQL